jgi:Phosphatidate phosphatase APP1, catalytic domain
MKNRHKLIVLLLVLGAGLAVWYFAFAAREQITFYQTYGYQDGNDWVVPLQLRVWERGLVQRALERRIADVASEAERFTGRQIDGLNEARFRLRIAAFAADDESRQRITIAFDKDPKDRRYSVTDPATGDVLRSDRNGRIDGQIRVPLDAATELLQGQGSRNGVLTYHAAASGHTGEGKLRLIPDTPGSLSVISDIDDTIKITEVPAGHRVLYLNTFVREFRSAPGMADRYKQWGDAAFHYVSGGPWQLYEPLFAFLPGEGFPDGSVHMRNFPLHLEDATKAKEFMNFLFDKEATARHKKQRIREIMTHFPSRTFVFVGDSGEADPEVYREIKDDPKFGHRVQAIFIRTVTESKEGRLDGMQVIEARRVTPDVSEFDK